MQLTLKMSRLLILLLLTGIFINCSDEDQLARNIQLNSDKTELSADGTDKITLKVTDEKGNDITSKSTISMNGTQWDKTFFTSDIAGDFVFNASYENLKTNSLKIRANPVIKHLKHVLVEDYTGTWCGYCPRVAKALEEIKSGNSKVDVVGIHYDNEMMFSDLRTLTNQFTVSGYPTAYIDRSYKWAYPENEAGLAIAFKNPAYCGIGIESEITGAKGKVNVKIEFAGGYVGSCKLVVFVTENNLKYNQVNFYSQYGANPIVNFNHDHVLRLSLTHPLGDSFTATNGGFSKEFVFDTTNYNKENLDIVAFVTNSISNECLNSRTSKVGVSAPILKL